MSPAKSKNLGSIDVLESGFGEGVAVIGCDGGTLRRGYVMVIWKNFSTYRP